MGHNPLKRVGKEIGRAAKHIADVSLAPAEAISKGLGEAFKPVLEGAGYVWNELNGTNAMLKAAELQNDYNLMYWQMQNEYNTPAAQMQRFKDAGLNPNLAYSLSNTAGDIGRVNVGTPDSALGVASKVISAISAWQGIKNMRLQNENLGYQAEYNSEMVRRARIDNDYLERNGLSTFSPSLPREVSGTLDFFKNRSINPFYWIYDKLGYAYGALTNDFDVMHGDRPRKPKGWTMSSRGDK